MLAEKANPRHDVIWGYAVTQMVDPRTLEMLEPYKPVGIDKVNPQFKDPDGRWFATTGYFAGFCVNTEVLKKNNLPMPTSWQDLLNPVYKGQIVMANAASSGTGYMQVVGILQQKGEEKGWQYLKELDKNIAQYIKSGSRPCKAAATGEYAIGVSFAFSGVKQIMEGFPIKLVIPAEGAAYETEVSGLMKTSKNKEDSKKFLDWLLTLEAAKLYGERAEMSSVPGAKATEAVLKAGLPADVSTVLYKMDFAASAKNKDRIIAEWKQKIER
jgi:iron(III) transport system substrate-binding protein